MTIKIPKHIMRYGIHKDRQYFLSDFRTCYDGVVFSGNFVAFSLQGISSFVSEIFADKDYFIDPITHAFGHHPQHYSSRLDSGDLKTKTSISLLAGRYRGPAEQYLGERALKPNDFSGIGACEEFTKNVLDFQINAVREGLGENKKYMLDEQECKPCLLIAPYFYLPPGDPKPWLECNLRFVDLARQYAERLPVFAEIVVSRDAFVDSSIRGQIANQYASCSADGIILWIENFSEHSASKERLKEYYSFVNNLVRSGKHVIISYAGYFSTIMLGMPTVGVCHGPGYGEERDVTPVGGGIPKPNFYFPKLHKRIQYRVAVFALRRRKINSTEDFLEKVCDCKICQQVLSEGFDKFSKYGESKIGFRRDGVAFEYATEEAKKISIAHYLYNKQREVEFVCNSDIGEIIQSLEEERAFCEEMFGPEEVTHLQAWKDTLETLQV